MYSGPPPWNVLPGVMPVLTSSSPMPQRVRVSTNYTFLLFFRRGGMFESVLSNHILINMYLLFGKYVLYKERAFFSCPIHLIIVS